MQLIVFGAERWLGGRPHTAALFTMQFTTFSKSGMAFKKSADGSFGDVELSAMFPHWSHCRWRLISSCYWRCCCCWHCDFRPNAHLQSAGRRTALQSLPPTQSSSLRRRDGRDVTSGDVISAYGADVDGAGSSCSADGVIFSGTIREPVQKWAATPAANPQRRRWVIHMCVSLSRGSTWHLASFHSYTYSHRSHFSLRSVN